MKPETIRATIHPKLLTMPAGKCSSSRAFVLNGIILQAGLIMAAKAYFFVSLYRCNTAKMKHFEQIELEAVSTNRRAIGLYVKYGFQVHGARPHGIKYPDGSYADDYLMRKAL